MEKIKLTNNTILDIIPMGINTNTFVKRRTFNISSSLTYLEIETLLTNKDNITSIQYLSENEEVLATYSDCASLKIISKDIETGVYTAEFSTDAVERELATMRAEVEALKNGENNR
jgi:hypothetical protein